MRGNRLHWFLLIGFGGLVITAGAYLLRPSPLEVEVGFVDCGSMQVTVSSEGRTRVRDRFVISSPVEGNLGRVQVKEGQAVKRGTILTWLTPAPLEVRYELERQASLQAAESERQAAEAQVARLRAELDEAERELMRVSELVKHGIRSRQDLDAAQTTQSRARQALNAANFAVDAAAAHIEEIRSTLLHDSNHATPIRSPVDGVVLRIIQQSERILPAGTQIAEIGNPRNLELVFDILSIDAVRVRAGASVLVQNWGGEETLLATVKLVEPGAFTKVSALGIEEQRVNVIAVLGGAAPPLGDGYRVEGEIVVWESADVIQVPVSALFRHGAEWQVFVVENGRVSLRAVQVSHRNQRMAEVLRGLSKGETVVLYPDDRLVSGKSVKPVQRD